MIVPVVAGTVTVTLTPSAAGLSAAATAMAPIVRQDLIAALSKTEIVLVQGEGSTAPDYEVNLALRDAADARCSAAGTRT